jgi:hypothetical protein
MERDLGQPERGIGQQVLRRCNCGVTTDCLFSMACVDMWQNKERSEKFNCGSIVARVEPLCGDCAVPPALHYSQSNSCANYFGVLQVYSGQKIKLQLSARFQLQHGAVC